MSDNSPDKPLPPGQQLVAKGKWPIIGEREPLQTDEPWRLEVTGLVETPISYSLDDLQSLGQTDVIMDIHCVTRWSKLGVAIQGVLLSELLSQSKPKLEANFISFVSRSNRNHSTSLKLEAALEHETIIGMNVDGLPLSPEHGGPFRNFVRGKYFYKSVKWLTRIELLETDRLGYWEAETGYHNEADPWKEQRYMVPTLDRRAVIRLIESRDFSGKDLRSIIAEDRVLNGLNAVEALLRDANFKGASLEKADFTNANLSNAHFQNAKLQNALFVGADIEGADFSGADLRGVDFTGCSLIGCSFVSQDENGTQHGATMDSSTQLPPEICGPLTPDQLAFVNQSLGRS